jgi:cytochrome P450
MIAFFLYMLKHPSCMEKLQAELLAAPDLSPPTLARLEYLTACLQEAMRLQPPSPANLQRMCPPGGAVICGKKIPEGTKVRFSNYAVQRDDRYFNNPDQFRPERWLKKSAESEKLGEKDTERLNEKAFFSFLIGPGACVAKTLAWMEMRLVSICGA